MATTEKPRIGVFVCHCGHNIAGVVDVEEVAKNAGNLPNVIYSTHEMFMCSDAGQRLIKDMIDEHDLNRIVVASCSPRMHETTFRRVIEEADLNRYLFEQVNLREHVSWCHMNQPQKATQKAKDLVRMSVARAAKLESLPIKTVDVTPQTLVLGGGIAGLRAALDIADRGFKVVLVERNEQLGGHVAEWSTLFPTMEEGADVINPMVKRTKENPNITVFTNSEVAEFEGYVGNFEAKIRNNATGSEDTLEVGAAIVATGFDSFEPHGYYGYGKSPDILTLADLERLKAKGELKQPSTGKPIKNVAFIGCVGSREPGKEGHEHCSRYCCTAVAKSASEMKDIADEVVILYRDVRTYGKNHEEIHRQARSKHVIFSKFPTDQNPDVEVKDGNVMLNWTDVLSDEKLHFEPDILVLASAMLPPEGIEKVANRFSLTRAPDGFFNPEHIKLAPLTTHTAGVMIAGAAQAPKNASEAVVDASGAAAKATGLMARKRVEIESTVSHVLTDLCSSCHTCVSTCPYGAISMDETEDPPIASVTEAKCHGCGTCAAACPSNAIVMRHSTDDQIMSMVEAYLCPPVGGKGGVTQ